MRIATLGGNAQENCGPPSLSVRHLDNLLDAGGAIANEPPQGAEISFVHSILCQVGLPRKRVLEREFLRRSGAAWMSVQAGFLDLGRGPEPQPIPYGPLPRLVLAWLSSYAVRHRTREIHVGDSAAFFLRELGMRSSGNRYATLRLQMHALAACRLQLGYQGRTFNGEPVEQFEAWVSPSGPMSQRALWPGVLVLSESYSRSLFDSAVPLDTRALHALKGSALALDIYAWLAHRLHRIEGKPVELDWRPLRTQFAQEYTGRGAHKDFRSEFLAALRKVQVVYPQAQVTQVRGGLRLHGSPPPVQRKLKSLSMATGMPAAASFSPEKLRESAVAPSPLAGRGQFLPRETGGVGRDALPTRQPGPVSPPRNWRESAA
jgi:hypothetical protein